MTEAEKKVLEAAIVAARFLPPPSFMRDSAGYKATKGLVAAVKAWRLAERAAPKEEAPGHPLCASCGAPYQGAARCMNPLCPKNFK